MKKSLYLETYCTLKVKDDSLLVVNKEGKRKLPVERIDAVYWIGGGSVSTSVFKLLKRVGLPLHFFNKHGYYVGSFLPNSERISGDLIIQQVKHYLDLDKRCYLAFKFVEGARANIVWVLRKHRIKGELPGISFCQSIAGLMQQEGQVRRVFYELIDENIKEEFRIIKRERRPPSNRANALLSFLNSMVYAKVLTEIFYTHLHPAISFLHEPFERRHSLALDVAEVFKPILSEHLFLKMVNLKMLDPKEDFEDEQGVLLSFRGRDKVLRFFESELKRTVRMRKSNKHRTIQELIRVELYKIEKHLLGIENYKPLKAWW